MKSKSKEEKSLEESISIIDKPKKQKSTMEFIPPQETTVSIKIIQGTKYTDRKITKGPRKGELAEVKINDWTIKPYKTYYKHLSELMFFRDENLGKYKLVGIGLPKVYYNLIMKEIISIITDTGSNTFTLGTNYVKIGKTDDDNEKINLDKIPCVKVNEKEGIYYLEEDEFTFSSNMPQETTKIFDRLDKEYKDKFDCYLFFNGKIISKMFSVLKYSDAISYIETIEGVLKPTSFGSIMTKLRNEYRNKYKQGGNPFILLDDLKQTNKTDYDVLYRYFTNKSSVIRSKILKQTYYKKLINKVMTVSQLKKFVISLLPKEKNKEQFQGINKKGTYVFKNEYSETGKRLITGFYAVMYRSLDYLITCGKAYLFSIKEEKALIRKQNGQLRKLDDSKKIKGKRKTKQELTTELNEKLYYREILGVPEEEKQQKIEQLKERIKKKGLEIM